MPRNYMSGAGDNRSGGSSNLLSQPTPAGAITPLPPANWDPAYGGQPATPNPITTAGQATLGNIGNLAALYRLSSGLNTFNNSQAISGLQHNLPGYSGMTAQSSANIGSMLKGNVPNDVVNEILQTAAERGIVTGGGPNSNAAMLRALGLTSLGLQQQGEQELTGAVARTPVARPWDPSQFFVPPDAMQAAALHASTVAASPVPADAAHAAQAAALAGLHAGAGAVPPYSNISPLPGGSPGTWTPRGELPTVVGTSTGTGVYRNGTLVPENPGAWNSWWNSGQQGTSTGNSGMTLDDMAAYLFGDDEAAPVGSADIPASGSVDTSYYG